MKRLVYPAALSLMMLVVFAPSAGAQSQQTVTVSIRDFFFDPAQITVAPGTTVRG